jgi:hypothetical protein
MVASMVYLALGLAWTFRSLLEVVAHPEYWEPATTLDWIAVWSYSLAFLLLAIAVPLLARQAATRRIVDAIAWVVAAGALLTALANGIEDGVGLESWGQIYVAAVLVTLAGSLTLAAALWIDQRPRFAVVVALWTAGFAFTTFGVGFLVLLGSVIAIDARRRTFSAAPD